MNFKVEITETLTLTKEVEATSKDDAEQYVRALYRAEEIILTTENSNIETSFKTHDAEN